MSNNFVVLGVTGKKYTKTRINISMEILNKNFIKDVISQTL